MSAPTVVPVAIRRLHVIAIPLTRPLPHSKSKRILTYYQFQIAQPPTVKGNGKEKESNTLARWLPESGVVNWASAKAAETWAGFGKQQKGWKRSIYEMGEKLMDRLDFEELALKSINPSMGPTITAPPTPSSSGSSLGKDLEESVKIPLLYPPSISTGSETLRELRALVSYRLPKHRREFYLWALIAPLTAPFVIVPVIPNIPFFFCVWRSWSHYRAYKASQYLDTLLEHGVIVPKESQLLDSVYKESETLRNAERSKSGGERQHAVLLTREAVPSIAHLFSLKRSAEADLYRAVEQARLRVESARTVL
ncbi:hypothetical protein AX15_003777 [Amanita polypyramis BW_CC]|nr:hypothetical protein AX15_003777 [Amanita polypyramis BW_CC]